MNIEILNLAVAAHVVLIERIDHVTIEGRAVHVRAMSALEVAGDKITARRDYFDTSHAAS